MRNGDLQHIILPQYPAPPQGRKHKILDRHRRVYKDIRDTAPIAEALDLVAPGAQIFVLAAQHIQVGSDLDRRAALGIEQPEIAIYLGVQLLRRERV